MFMLPYSTYTIHVMRISLKVNSRIPLKVNSVLEKYCEACFGAVAQNSLFAFNFKWKSKMCDGIAFVFCIERCYTMRDRPERKKEEEKQNEYITGKIFATMRNYC